MLKRALCALAALGLLACGSDGGGGGAAGGLSTDGPDGGGGMRTCTDEDEDGFGRFCDQGRDCDDDDPDLTDECWRCVEPADDCPCEPGTPPMGGCDPEDMVVTMNGVQGVLVCSEGTRYCRDGAWSACEILFQYATFVPNE